MSDTPTATPTAHWSLTSIIAAVDSAAGLVLHKAHALEQNISTWTSDHPQVGPLIAAAAKYATGLLGGSWPLLVTAEQAVEAALGAIARSDDPERVWSWRGDDHYDGSGCGAGGGCGMTPQSPLPAAARVLGTTGAAWLLLSALALAGCATAPTPATTQTAASAVTTLATVAAASNSTAAALVTKGQLFCGYAGSIVAVVADLATPTSVIGQGAQTVAAVCGAINAVPVSPPANPGATPVAVVAGAAALGAR
jgi:hypothetical protein